MLKAGQKGNDSHKRNSSFNDVKLFMINLSSEKQQQKFV